MYFHQPIVCFFFSNNASVIVLTKALRSFVCLCLFVSVVTLSEHRTSRNVGTMFVRCFYNVHTMFAQCSYNVRTMAKKVRTMFVQCPTKVRTILYELFGHCTNFVCAAINVRWYIKKCQQTGPSILQWFCYFSGCILDNEIVTFVLAFLWPAARARLGMRDLMCMLYTVPRKQSYRWVYQAMQVRPRQPGSFDIIWQGKPVTTCCRAKACFHPFPSTTICFWILD